MNEPRPLEGIFILPDDGTINIQINGKRTAVQLSSAELRAFGRECVRASYINWPESKCMKQ